LLLFSFGGYGLALAALALVVFGAYDSYPFCSFLNWGNQNNISGKIDPAKDLRYGYITVEIKPRFGECYTWF